MKEVYLFILNIVFLKKELKVRFLFQIKNKYVDFNENVLRILTKINIIPQSCIKKAKKTYRKGTKTCLKRSLLLKLRLFRVCNLY